MLQKFKFVLLFLFVFGCNDYRHDFPCTMYLDESLTQDEKEAAKDAVRLWYAATDGIVQINLKDEQPSAGIINPHILSSVPANDERAVYQKRNDKLTSLWGFAYQPENGSITDHEGGGVFLIPEEIEKFPWATILKRATIVHEFGHHVGLDHMYDGIMMPGMAFHNLETDPYAIPKVCIYQSDLEQFCQRYQNCEGKKLKETCLKNPEDVEPYQDHRIPDRHLYHESNGYNDI